MSLGKNCRGQMMCQEDRSPFGGWGAGAGKPKAHAQAELRGPPQSSGALEIWVVWSQASSLQREASTQPAPGPSPKSRKIILTVETKERRRSPPSEEQRGWQALAVLWPVA